MMKAPLWMRALRWYALHSPIQRGLYRLALWLYQRCSIPDIEVDTLLDGTLWMKLCLKVWVDYNIYCLGMYEAPFARFFIRSLRPDSVVLDIGAYIGQYTLLAPKYASAGRVIALEPHPISYQRLQAHVACNRLGNVCILHQAAGQMPGRLPFALSEQAFDSGFSSGWSGETIEVEVVPVDEVVCQMNLKRVDVMKVDVEGAEGQVLRGAQETLARFHPLLIVEIDKRREQAFGDDPEALRRELESLCYTLYILRRHRLIPISNQVRDYENVIAIPAKREHRDVDLSYLQNWPSHTA